MKRLDRGWRMHVRSDRLINPTAGDVAQKKGGVDLSAFHATQGRRIVDTSITPGRFGGSRGREIFF
jgi:hypothetical protein